MITSGNFFYPIYKHDSCLYSRRVELNHRRLEQLLAAQALAVADRVREATQAASAQEGSGPAALVHLKAHPGGSVGDLERVVGLSQTGAGRLVDRLAEAGLVERRAGRDGRTQALLLTREGLKAAARVLELRAKAVAPLLEHLTPAERLDLERLLERIIHGLAHDRPGALRVCRLCDRAACYSGPGCPLDHAAQTAQ
jgi:DNA-binding MarR family transcriptional regulator